jgi:hypothetical protein
MSEMMYDSAFKDKEFNLDNFNPHEVYDSFVYGALAGGALGGGIAALPSSNTVPHSKVAEDKQKIDEELRAMAADYNNETDPDIKKAKKKLLQEKLAAFDAINGAGADAYATLNEDEAVQVAAVNRRIAQLQDQIKSGKDLAGIEYNPEQLAEKKAEMEKLYEVKKEIEGKAFSREYAEENQGQLPLFVEDAEGNQVETQAKATPQNVTEQHRTLEKEEMTAEEEQQASTFELDTEAMAEERAPANFVDIQPENMNSQFLSDNDVPTELHETILNMYSAFENTIKQLGINVVYMKDADSYAREVEGSKDARDMITSGKTTLGSYNPNTNTIYLYDYRGLDLGQETPSLIDTARHEFSHGVLKSIIGQNADSRSELYNQISQLTESDPRLKRLIEAVEQTYSTPQEGQTEEDLIKEKEEEAIVAILVDYAANPSKYSSSLKQKIIDLINRLFSKYSGNSVINSETDLMGVAKAFERAAKTGKKTEVGTKAKKESATPRKSKPFTYLNQAQIYYTYNPAAKLSPESAGDFSINRLAPRNESVKVNDYNHFRNWYNKMTGNGRVKMIESMYHIVDGKRRAIKPPKPRLNKDGSVMHIDLPKTPLQRRMEAAKKKREEEVARIKEVNAARDNAFNIMTELGLDFSRMPLRDFMPREEGMTAEEFRRMPETPEMYEAAVKNMYALMESGFDPAESFKKFYDRDKHIDLYTMGEGDYVTPIEEVTNEIMKEDEEGGPTFVANNRKSRLIKVPIRDVETAFRFVGDQPESVTGKSVSALAKEAVDKYGVNTVSADFIDGEPCCFMGYDLTKNEEFGPVELISQFVPYNMKSGLTSSEFLSARSESKGKALAGQLQDLAEVAKAGGKDYINIVITAQDPKRILGNSQAFDYVLDYLFNFRRRTMTHTAKTDEQDVKRLKAFLIDKKDGSNYLNGSSSEPGVLNVLRYGLIEFMKDNKAYSDYLSEDRNNGRLAVNNLDDYNDIYSAIKEFASSPNLNKYIGSFKNDYPKDKDGNVYVLGENKNINFSQAYANASGEKVGKAADAYDTDSDGVYDRIDSKSVTNSGSPGNSDDLSQGFNSYVFRNYAYGAATAIYGVGGGNYYGQFRVNLDQNRIEIGSNGDISEVVIEYVADEGRSKNPSVHVYAEEALMSYMYYKIIERKASVPANEKARARQEYYNERRKANARIKSFTKEEALKTIRKNYRQAPKF